MKIKSLFAAVGVIGLLVSTGASADFDWTFSPGSGSVPHGPYSAGGTSTTVTTSGWRNTTSSTDHTSTSYGAGKLLNVDSDGLSTTYLAYYDDNGLGVRDGSNPQHAVDNDGWVESVLVSFSNPVTLSQVRFGWVGSLSGSSDYDFTLAAYTGAGNPTPSLTSLEYAQLAGNGWGLIESHFNDESHAWAGSDPVFSVNSGNTSSSYWLISALNPKLDSANKGYAAKRDFFKLYSVSGKTPPPGVPEPSTLSLLLVGLLMAGYLSSQKRQRAAGRLAA